MLSTGGTDAAADAGLSGPSAPDPDQAPNRSDTLDVTVVLPCYNEQDHVLAEIERISRRHGRQRLQLRADGDRRQVDRQHAGRVAGGPAAVPAHAADRVSPQRRIGHRPADRHHRRLRPDRGVDRCRHDLPERAHSRVRAVPARPSRHRPGRRRPHERAGDAQVPSRPGEVGHPQDRRVAVVDVDPGPQLGPAGVPARGVIALSAPAAARLLVRHDDHAVVPVEPARRRLPADRLRAAGRRRASSTSSATPTATSCRCYG